MKWLLDTHLLLWAASAPEALPPRASDIMTRAEHELLFSAASLWEVAIKAGLGRPDFDVDAALLRRGLLDHGYIELTIDSRHAVGVTQLPALHKDPFDRLLIAQAYVEGIMLMTADALVAQYPGPILKV